MGKKIEEEAKEFEKGIGELTSELNVEQQKVAEAFDELVKKLEKDAEVLEQEFGALAQQAERTADSVANTLAEEANRVFEQVWEKGRVE